MFNIKNKKQKAYTNLSINERRYINKILSKKIFVFVNDEDKKCITSEEVKKLKYIFKYFNYSYEFLYCYEPKFYEFRHIKYSSDLLKNITLTRIRCLKEYLGIESKYDVSIVKFQKIFYNCDIIEFLSKIAIPCLYANNKLSDELIQELKNDPEIKFGFHEEDKKNKLYEKLKYDYFVKAGSLDYTIDQKLFLISHGMIYNHGYNDKFDYEEIYNECTKLGLDVTKNYVNDYSLEFLKSLKKRELLLNEEKRCKVLNSLYRYCSSYHLFFEIGEEVFETFISNGFTSEEIILVCNRGDVIKPQNLKVYFNNGGTKEELILKCAIENTKSNKEGE